ncbi:hypothetical protein ED312_06515 [Sinomicrobium pectinilyticum]|uniref:Protein SirB1 N-terminal domain-containing protein n=1 Tax=Sinomicrobium pectinilyticum TaxID=1084421 RepID=A0A3N0ER08_SINP1|nr:hypothetical protein [Sinomicrobium pectinilyticum]RNL90320.1 hypothetical protein ED312_06515 [Sinomicrobium pectinilyticum]
MKKYLIYCILFFSCFCTTAQKQEKLFEQSYALLDSMLEDKTAFNFKKAVFSTENAYLNGKLDTRALNKNIAFYTNLAKSIVASKTLVYGEKDRETVNKWFSIFQVMCDTVPFYLKERQYISKPFGYDFTDVFGHQSKESLFVSKLLTNHKGNCRSLPYLYKILAEELGVDANLALAPNHVYIKHKSERHGWYNTELTSGIFPIDAWIMASGFVHVDAITNGVYMKALDNKESIALLLVDLANNYNAIYPENDGTFVLKCAETAIKAYPHFGTALILRAETHKKQIEEEKDNQVASKRFTLLEKEYQHIHEIGYRNMPEQMYLNWLVSLKTERNKYENKNLNTINKK